MVHKNIMKINIENLIRDDDDTDAENKFKKMLKFFLNFSIVITSYVFIGSFFGLFFIGGLSIKHAYSLLKNEENVNNIFMYNWLIIHSFILLISWILILIFNRKGYKKETFFEKFITVIVILSTIFGLFLKFKYNNYEERGYDLMNKYILCTLLFIITFQILKPIYNIIQI